METTDIRVHRGAAWLHVELDRPAKRNALTGAMYAAMADALAAAEADDAIRAVIFSGAGTDFCAGNDLADFLAAPADDPDKPVFRFIRALANATKILIAAVQGRAIGIGTTMLLHCDFVFAEAGAAFQMPFVDLGLVPEAGSSLLVPQLVGARIAAEWLLLGDRIGAERAAACGLANRVVAAGQALPEAMAVAARLAGKPGGALVATKRLMKSPEQDMHARIEEENRGFQSRLGTEEVRHVINQFFEQRAKATAA